MTDKTLSMPPPYEEYRAQQALAAQRQAAELEMDETVAGGRYVVGDQVVNADGKPIKGDDAAAKKL